MTPRVKALRVAMPNSACSRGAVFGHGQCLPGAGRKQGAVPVPFDRDICALRAACRIRITKEETP